MATRASVAIQTGDVIRAIYSHWDGYPEGLGTTLEASYKDKARVLSLVSMGDASSISDTIEESVFYHRDRGEELRFHEFLSVEDWLDWARESWAEYAYLMREDSTEWETFEQGSDTRLKSVFEGVK